MDFVVERVNEAEGLVHLNREGAVTRTTWNGPAKSEMSATFDTDELVRPDTTAEGLGKRLAPDLSLTFDKPEAFLKFKCDVHPWMFAYCTVVDHPYFAVTDKDGKFTIKNVPAGKYAVEVAHRKAGTTSQEVEIKADGGKADFTIEAK